MLPSQLTALLHDDNGQNVNAANAGDGPKHIAWLTFIELLGPSLRTLIETHSGGGIYRVPTDRFCVGLPTDSILGKHQATAGLPIIGGAETYYSASGDQALLRMPEDCRYLAFDKNTVTARRLEEAASWRKRRNDLQSTHAPYAGDGSPAKRLSAVIGGKPGPALVMVDPPCHVRDLEKAAKQVRSVGGLRAILFGCAKLKQGCKESKEGWDRVIALFKGQHRVRWEWTGDAEPNKASPHLFFLLVTTPEEAEADKLQTRLLSEHRLLETCRVTSHRYASGGPHRLP